MATSAFNSKCENAARLCPTQTAEALAAIGKLAAAVSSSGAASEEESMGVARHILKLATMGRTSEAFSHAISNAAAPKTAPAPVTAQAKRERKAQRTGKTTLAPSQPALPEAPAPVLDTAAINQMIANGFKTMTAALPSIVAAQVTKTLEEKLG